MPRPFDRLLSGICTLVLAGGMLTPGEQLPDGALFSYDKLIHVVAFGGWTVLAVRALGLERRRLIAALGGLLAASTEIAQETITVIHRSGEVVDVLADVLGIALGIAAMHGAAEWRRRRAEAAGLAPTASGQQPRPS